MKKISRSVGSLILKVFHFVGHIFYHPWPQSGANRDPFKGHKWSPGHPLDTPDLQTNTLLKHLLVQFNYLRSIRLMRRLFRWPHIFSVWINLWTLTKPFHNFNLLLLKSDFVDLNVCLHPQWYWQIKSIFIFRSLTETRMLWVKTGRKQQPRSMMLPLPSFTVLISSIVDGRFETYIFVQKHGWCRRLF